MFHRQKKMFNFQLSLFQAKKTDIREMSGVQGRKSKNM